MLKALSGIGGRISGAWGWITSAKYWLAVVLLVGVAGFLKGCDHGKKITEAKYATAALKAMETQALSAGEAAAEREADEAAIDAAQGERDAAIIAAEGGDAQPSAVSIAANCKRLEDFYSSADLATMPHYTKFCTEN